MDTNEAVTGHLFLDNLHAMYYTAKHLVVMFGKIQGKCADYELKNIFTGCREVNKGHIRRMEKVFSILGEEPSGRKCEEIQDVIREADDVIRRTPEYGHSRDAGLIKAAQKAESYGMDICSKLAELAKNTGLAGAAKLLQQSLEEEKQASATLTRMQEKLAYSWLAIEAPSFLHIVL